MENKTRNNIIRVLHKKMGEIHEVLDTIDNCDVADCEEPGYAWCEEHPDRRICSYHATTDAEHECYFCPECYAGFLADQVPDHYGEATEMVDDDQTKTPEIKPMESAFSDYQIGDTALVRVVLCKLHMFPHGPLRGADVAFAHDPEQIIGTVAATNLVPKCLIPRAEHERALDDVEPIGWANRHKGGAWSGMFLNAITARTCAEFGDWAEIAIPLYRHPAPVAPTAVAPAKITDGDCVEHLVGEFVADGGVGKRTYTRSADGLECELSINVKGRGDTQAVALKGVKERLLALSDSLKDANKPWMSTIARAIANDITELPEPSEGYSEWARLNVLNQGWTANELKQIAAALLAKEGEV